MNKNDNHTFLIVGLGNPGERYEKSPHNIGRDTLLHLKRQYELPGFEFNKYWNGQVSKGEIEGVPVVLLAPETFMNRSGQAVSQAIAELGVHGDHLVVIHDDVDCAQGTAKVSYDRNAGGHKGVESIINAFGSTAFARVRIGISELKGSDHSRDLLRPMQEGEMQGMVKLAGQAVRVILIDGIERAMNTFNRTE